MTGRVGGTMLITLGLVGIAFMGGGALFDVGGTSPFIKFAFLQTVGPQLKLEKMAS